MSNKLYEESDIQAIADAIRAKGQTGTMKVSQMAGKVAAIQTGIEPQAYEWQQTPVPVQRYVDEVTYTFANPAVYSDADYASSQIATYTALGSGERPVGKTINFSEAGELNQGGYRKTISAGDNTIYNDIPQVKTPYTLTTAGNGVKNTGTLKPTAWLRQINVSARNVRDLGGRPCYNSDGEIEGYIRYGKLFRGAEVYTQEDVDIFLDQLGIRAELDLQSEEAHTTHILSDHVDYCAPMVVGGQWIWYTLTHKEEIKTAFHFIFDSLKRNKPLFFHCIAGCDRTGTIACIIENLLGCSRSDIDKDFELSSWYDSRLRTSSDWKNLQREIGALSGDSYRDKLVNFFATLGFTAAEINAFRAEMIDPTGASIETVTPSIGTQTITKTLTHVTNSNTATSITQYQSYEAKLTPDSGYAIDNVRITMGGVDITSQAFNGTETNLYRKVTKTLSHCIADGKIAVIDGQDFVCELTADDGYTLDEEAGASIVVTVGGAQVYPTV